MNIATVVKSSKAPSAEARNQFPIWYDTRNIQQSKTGEGVLERVIRSKYSGIILYADNYEKYEKQVSGHLQKIIHVRNQAELAELVKKNIIKVDAEQNAGVIVASGEEEVLKACRKYKVKSCFRAFVKDADSLQQAMDLGKKYEYVSILFEDPTNIPLELVIATLQTTDTILMKEVNGDDNVEDAIVSLGVMEVGADGIIFSPRDHKVYETFITEVENRQSSHVKIQTGIITKSEPVGMGYRSCIDLAVLFAPNEGMLVGSTSQGGILCCPEVFHLPYMELRPFRVNAGGVHSYIFNTNNKTDYMTELKAGSTVMVVSTDGKVSKFPVGRMKTEIRPLRLIEAKFEGDKVVNIIMQDDWHVRIFSDKGTPINITELKPGDKVLGYVTDPGRHVGIKITEQINEK